MNTETDRAGDGLDLGPGIVEIRPITSRCFGIRVERRLVAKLKDIVGITRANAKSDLFCIELDGMNNNPDDALRRFRELAALGGAGAHFGVKRSKRPRA